MDLRLKHDLPCRCWAWPWSCACCLTHLPTSISTPKATMVATATAHTALMGPMAQTSPMPCRPLSHRAQPPCQAQPCLPLSHHHRLLAAPGSSWTTPCPTTYSKISTSILGANFCWRTLQLRTTAPELRKPGVLAISISFEVYRLPESGCDILLWLVVAAEELEQTSSWQQQLQANKMLGAQ